MEEQESTYVTFFNSLYETFSNKPITSLSSLRSELSQYELLKEIEPKFNFNHQQIFNSITEYFSLKQSGVSKSEDFFLRTDFKLSKEDFNSKPLYIANIILIITALSSKNEHYMTEISEMKTVYQDLWSDIFASYLAIHSERSNTISKDNHDNDNEHEHDTSNANDILDKTHIQQLLDDITRLKAQIDTMKKENTDLQGTISDFEADMNKQEETKIRLNDVIGNLEVKNRDLMSKNDLLESKYEMQSKTIADLELHIKGDNEKTAQLKEQYINDLAYLRKQSETASIRKESNVSEKDEKINVLQIRITQLEREKEGQRRSFIETDTSNQTNIYIPLSKENAKLKEIISNNMEEIERDKKELEEYSKLIEKMQQIYANNSSNGYNDDKDELLLSPNKEDKDIEGVNRGLFKFMDIVKASTITYTGVINPNSIKIIETKPKESINDTNDYDNQLKEKEMAIKQLTKTNETSQVEIDIKEKQITELQKEKQLTAKTIDDLVLDNKRLSNENTSITEQVNQLTNDITQLTESKYQIEEELKLIKEKKKAQQVSFKEDKSIQVTDDKEKDKEKENAIAIDKLNKQIQDLKDQLSSLQLESNEYKSTIEKQLKDISNLTSTNSQLMLKLKEKENAIKTLKAKPKPQPYQIHQQKQIVIKGLYDRVKLESQVTELSSLKHLLNSFNTSTSMSHKEKLTFLISSFKTNESTLNTHKQQILELKSEVDTLNKTLTALNGLMVKYFSITKFTPSSYLLSTEERLKQINAHLSQSQATLSENTRLNTLVKNLNNQLAKYKVQQGKLQEELEKMQKEAVSNRDKELSVLKNENSTLKQMMIEMKNKEKSEHDIIAQSLNALVGQFNKLKTDIKNDEGSFNK